MTIEPQEVPADEDVHNDKSKVRCTSVAWSANQKKLYVGCSDGHIRVYNILFSSS